MKKFLPMPVVLLAFLGSFGEILAQKYTVSRYIKDLYNGESLIGAKVFDRQSLNGSSSNTYVYYSLSLPGYTPHPDLFLCRLSTHIVTLTLRQNTTIHLELPEGKRLDEVVISATEAVKIQKITQMSAIAVPIEQVKSLPAFLGEVDVLKTPQLLPGEQSGNEGSIGLYVQGGYGLFTGFSSDTKTIILEE